MQRHRALGVAEDHPCRLTHGPVRRGGRASVDSHRELGEPLAPVHPDQRDPSDGALSVWMS